MKEKLAGVVRTQGRTKWKRVKKQLKVYNFNLVDRQDKGWAGGLVGASKSSKTRRGWPNRQVIQKGHWAELVVRLR